MPDIFDTLDERQQQPRDIFDTLDAEPKRDIFDTVETPQPARSGIAEAGRTIARETLKIVPTLYSAVNQATKPLLGEARSASGEVRDLGAMANRWIDEKLGADPARTGFTERLLTQTIPGVVPSIVAAVATKSPRTVLGGLGASSGLAQAAEEAKAANLSPGAEAGLSIAKGALGALDAAGGVAKQLAGGAVRNLAKTVAEETGISTAQVVGGNAASRFIAGDERRGLTDDLGQAVAASIIVPGTIHGIQTAVKAPDPLTNARAFELLRRTPGVGEVTMDPQSGDITTMFQDGRKFQVRFKQADAMEVPAEQQREFLASTEAAFPQEFAAARQKAGADDAAVVKILRDEHSIAPFGQTVPTMDIAQPGMKPVPLRAVIELASGSATKGTLKHEELHALLKMADVPDAEVMAAGRAATRRQAEENLAVALERAADSPIIRGFAQRLAERFLGKQGYLRAAEALRERALADMAGRAVESRASEAWNARRAELEQIIGRPMKSATPEDYARAASLKQADLFAQPEAKPQELPDTATPAQRKFAEIFWHKNTSVQDREAMLRAKALGVADDLLSQFPLRSEGLTPEESARLLAFNEKAKQGTLGLQGQQATPEPIEGPQRVVGSRFQQPQPNTTQPSGTAPKFVSGEQQALGVAPAQPAMPMFERGARSVTEGGRDWKRLKFSDPVDDLAYNISRMMGNKRKQEQAAFLRGELARVTGLPADQVDAHIAEVRQAVKDFTLKQPAGVVEATIPKLKIRSAQERGAAMQQAEAQRLAAIEAADAEAAQRRAEGEAQRQAEAQRRAEERAATDARLAAEAEQRRQAEAARRAEMDAVLARDDWRNELAKSADELEAGGGFGVGSGITKADAPALRAAAAGKQLTPKQFEVVQNFVKTIGEPRPVAEVTAEAERGAEVPEAGTQGVAEFQTVEEIARAADDLVNDAIEPEPPMDANGREGGTQDLPFSVGKRRKAYSMSNIFYRPELVPVDEAGRRPTVMQTWGQDKSFRNKQLVYDDGHLRIYKGELLRLGQGAQPMYQAQIKWNEDGTTKWIPAQYSNTRAGAGQLQPELGGLVRRTNVAAWLENATKAAQQARETERALQNQTQQQTDFAVELTPQEQIRYAVGKRRSRANPDIMPSPVGSKGLAYALEVFEQDQQANQQMVDAAVARMAANPSLARERVLSGTVNAADMVDAHLTLRVADELHNEALSDPALAADAMKASIRALEQGAFAGRLLQSRQYFMNARKSAADLLRTAMMTPSEDLQRKLLSNKPEVQQQAQEQARVELENARRLAEEAGAGHWEPMTPDEAAGIAVANNLADGGVPSGDAVPSGSGRPGQETPATAGTIIGSNVELATEMPVRETAQANPLPLSEMPNATPGGAAPTPDGARRWVWNENFLKDPQRVDGLRQQMAQKNARLTEKWFEAYRNMLMSGIRSQTGNAAGSALNVGWNKTGQWLAEAVVNDVRRAFGKDVAADAATFNGIAAAYRDLAPIVHQASRDFISNWRSEVSKFATMSELNPGTAIGGKTGRVVRLPQRLNAAVDEFFTSIAAQMNLRMMAVNLAERGGLKGADLDNAVAQLMAKPPEQLRAKAIEQALEETFKGNPGTIGNWMLKLRDSKDTGAVASLGRLVMMLNFPFIKTPVNILRIGAKASPIGLARMMAKAFKGHYKAGSEQNTLTQDMATQLLGLAGGAVLFGMTAPDQDGIPQITGSNAKFGRNRKDFLGNAIPPRSIRIGGKWVSYARLEPLATYLQATIDLADMIRDGKSGVTDSGQVAGRFWNSMKGLVSERTYLQQLDNLMKTIDGEPRRFERYFVDTTASLLTPSLIRSTIRDFDPNVYAKYYGSGGPEEGTPLAQQIAYRSTGIPAFAPPRKVDYWGRPITKSGPWNTEFGNFLYRLTMPAEVRDAQSLTNFDRMLWNYYRTNPDKVMPTPPEDTYQIKGVQMRMTQDEYATFAARRGEIGERILRQSRIPWNFDEPKPWMVDRVKDAMAVGAARARDELIARKLNGPEREQFVRRVKEKIAERDWGIKPAAQ